MANRRDLIKMTGEEIEAFLHERQTMNIATFGPDGNIHLVAMWYGFINGNPAFETYAKSQKIKNLQRDPRITVLVEDGDEYNQLRGVEIVGRGSSRGITTSSAAPTDVGSL
jgi:nitroimidazol reductase NimA-like FMN-containing flavoprotein (pyridoxamine 5'-phosphate oxidase superfamily)